MISGKWHVGDERQHWPDQRGFDRSFSMIWGASNYFNLKPYIHENQKENVISKDGHKYKLPVDFYMTTAFTDHALQLLDERPEKEQPFFMYLSYTAPHWPLHALPEDIDKFESIFPNALDPHKSVPWSWYKCEYRQSPFVFPLFFILNTSSSSPIMPSSCLATFSIYSRSFSNRSTLR